MSRFLSSLVLAIVLTGSAQAAEIGPITLFQPGAGHMLELNMEAAPHDVDIGGYKVTNDQALHVCATGGTPCADWYAGAVLQLEPRDKLVIHLKDSLPSGGGPTPDACMAMPGSGSDRSLLNLHMHGLLVSPYARGAGANLSVGDNVFHCTSSAGSNGAVVGNTLHYELTLADNAPGRPHPMGIDWIHPHVHGLAKLQVSMGMTGMIEVGRVNQELCAKPGQSAQCQHVPVAAIKHIMLRDAQLVKLAGQPAQPNVYHNYADENSDFCGANKFNSTNFGECALDPATLADNTVASGRWVFTINGLKMPHWDIAPNLYEVWRIQNASAIITYHLSLQALAYGPGIPTTAPFQVLNMDGAGLASAGGGNVALPTATDILLMPSSRVDLLVQAPTQMNADMTYALVNDNYQAGFVASDADVWPHIVLGTITFKGVHQHYQAVQPPATTAPAAALMAAPAVDEGKLAAALPAECDGFDDPGLTDANKQFYHDHLHAAAPWKRRVYFGVDDTNNVFALGTSLIDSAGVEYDLFGRNITGGSSNQPATLDVFDMSNPKSALCVRKDAGSETWQLVNISNEVHNFHIHQIKFAVARDGSGAPVMRTPSLIDAVGLPNQLLFKQGLADLLHDVIVVPRGQSNCTNSLSGPNGGPYQIVRTASNPCDGTGSSTDTSGMIEIKLTFDGSQFIAYDDGTGTKHNARFVFHCHILEHEDDGMMAAITVIDPAQYH